MLLNNKEYNLLKWIAQILLPALGTLYFAMSAIWHLPKVEEVVGSITVVDTFLGLLLGVSTKHFNNQSPDTPDGDLIISETDGEKYFGLGISKEAFEGIGEKTAVRLNVVRNKPAE